MKLTGNWVHTTQIGYGRMACSLIPALERAGVEIQDGMEQGPTNVVNWMSTPSHARWYYEGQYVTLLSMWESQRLAEGMSEGLLNFDLVLVPSVQNLELFSDHHPNVKLVLLGVDEEWSYRPRREPDLYFDFLIGGSGPRKGTDLAFDAFQKVFGDWHGDGPIPRLIMKNPRREKFVGERVEVIGGRISAEEELALYARSHVYLQPSRGEGFGLQPLQAIAQGLPTILTDAHGHASFAHLGYGIGSSNVEADYFSHGYAGDWWEPDFGELCERMEWIYDNYDEAAAFAKQSAEVASREFTWDNSARMMIDAIGRDRLEAPYEGSGEKVDCKLTYYKTMVLEPWKAEIAGVHYQFEPGQVYYEPADVLRILFDGGKLDPACLENPEGLNPQQRERLGSYSAAHSFCLLCHQLHNSEATKAEYLMAKNEVERLTRENAELKARLGLDGPKNTGGQVKYESMWSPA